MIIAIIHYILDSEYCNNIYEHNDVFFLVNTFTGNKNS